MKVPKSKAELLDHMQAEALMMVDAKWAFDILLERTPVEGIDLDTLEDDDTEGFTRYSAASDIGFFLASKLLDLVCEGIRDPRELAIELLNYFLVFTTMPKTMREAETSAPPCIQELLLEIGSRDKKMKA